MNRELADNIKVLAFDVFGTVVDWRKSIMREVRLMDQRRKAGDEFQWFQHDVGRPVSIRSL